MLMKRVFDTSITLLALPILVPLIIVIAIIVRVFLGGPVLFRQMRIGLNGQHFEMIKFRTMSDERDANGELLPDADRLGALGKSLRATSLDELPELWNVLKGEMSLVGPRPLPISYHSLFSSRQFARHEMRPGITGWAQINGRNDVTWPQKLEMDVWYIRNHSHLLDLKIILLTVGKLLNRSEITKTADTPMPPFRGEQ